MKKIFTLFSAFTLLLCKANSQVVLNELYTDPGSGKHEFFELYNTNPGGSTSTDDITVITYFEISGQKGFYVMDLPNMSIASRSYFVGSSALPFNYQGTTNSTASDFSWNSSAFTSNNGYIRKWVQGTANLLDGNLFYDQATVPANFNDFLYRRTGTGASYSVFLYKGGELANTFIGGTGGSSVVLNEIVNMPVLYVDMSATATDFTINFSGYGSLPIEYCTNDAGSDNGYIREFDGACASWKKSSSQVQHTPKASNGTLIGFESGSVSIAAAISPGTPATGSVLSSNIVAAPSNYFPIEMQIFKDMGATTGKLDASDVYLASNTEITLSNGPYYNTFFPYNASILIAAKTNAGCFDKIIFIPNSIVLSVKMISFDGNRVNQDIHLNWNVEQNEEANRFEVQKSTDGVNFSTEAIVFATEKNGQQAYNYNTNAPVSGTVVYRLLIFNKNSTVNYSKTLSFSAETNSKNVFAIINNPVSDKLSLNYQAAATRPVQVSVIDMSGRMVLQASVNTYTGKNEISIPLNSSIRTGTYIVDLFDGLDHYTAKFIK